MDAFHDETFHLKNRLEQSFVRFRTSSAFVWSVVIFIATWVAWNLIPGLPRVDDPNEFGHLNLLLSMEATIATVLLMRDNARSRLREMQMLEALHEQILKLKQIERDIDEVQEAIEDQED